MMFCRWCGKESVNDDSLYCPSCGQDLADYPAPAADLSGERAFCGACGASNKTGYLYCTSCGSCLDTPAAAERIKETIAQAAPRLNSPTALIGQVRGNWLSAACGAGAAAAVGIIISILSTTVIGSATHDPYSGMSIQLSPLALWVYTHLPALYLGMAAEIEGFRINADASFRLPFFIGLLVPLLSLWVGSLVSNRGLERNDWLNRTVQALRTAALYVGLLFIVSLCTGFNMSNVLPLDLMFSDLSSMGFGIVLKFQWFSVLLYGLIWAVVFGVLVSAGRRGIGRLFNQYAGDKWSPVLSGIGRAMAASIIGGAAVALAAYFYLVSAEGLGGGDVAAATTLFILALPNLLLYGLGIGGGAALKVTSNIPGEEMFFTISVLQQDAFSHWSLYAFCLVVVVSLLWGGYRAARRNSGGAFWQTGLLVAAGYGLIISTLSWIAQFKVDINLGDLSELMYFFGAAETGKFTFFAGTGFWATLFGLTIIGAVAASLGAFLAGRRPPE